MSINQFQERQRELTDPAERALKRERIGYYAAAREAGRAAVGAARKAGVTRDFETGGNTPDTVVLISETPYVDVGDGRLVAVSEAEVRTGPDFQRLSEFQYSLFVKLESGLTSAYAEIPKESDRTAIVYPGAVDHPQDYNLVNDDQEVVAVFAEVTVHMQDLPSPRASVVSAI